MSDKNAFMANIRKALGISADDKREASQWPGLLSAGDDTLTLERIKYRTDVEKQALLQVLQKSSQEVGLKVYPVVSHGEAAEKIKEIIDSSSPEFHSIKQIVQHDHPDIVELKLWKKLAGDPVQIHTTYVADTEVRSKSIESYIGITSPKWVVAESATMVQLTAPGQPRSTSLVPSVHIAVIRIKNILADLTELYALLREEKPEDSYLFITGPSKTADIEAHLVFGAHGPKDVHLIIIDDQLAENRVKGSGIFS